MIIQTLCVILVSDFIFATIPPTGKDLENNPFYRRDYEYDLEYKSFYKLHKDVVSRSEAVSMCVKEGSEMLVPEIPAELSHLDIKLDLDTINSTGIFIGDINKCALFRPNIRISNMDCQNKMPFVCKRTLSSLKYDSICQTWDPDSTKSRCYKVHPEIDSWNAAFATCHAEHSYLAVINSQTEANLFTKKLNKYPRLHTQYYDHWDGSWLGFHNLFIDTEFRTVHGEMLSKSGYEIWDKLQPSGGERCGQMIRDGLLNDRNCDAIDLFICEREIFNFTSTARRNERCGLKPDVNEIQGENSSLRSDYPTEYGRNFYKLHMNSSTWAEAEQRCRSEGALLATPESREEVDVMVKLLQEQSLDNTLSLYVGVHGIFSDGVFVTVEGLDVSMIHNEWSSQSRRKYEDCVSLERDGHYRAVYCHKKKPFICKKSMVELDNRPCTMVEIGYFPGVKENVSYKLYKEERNWEDANITCHLDNAVMAQITSKEILSLLADHLAVVRAGEPEEKQLLFNSIHIDKIVSCTGFCDDDFHTVQDYLAGYESEDQCNFLHSDGHITDGSCDNLHYFFCQREIHNNSTVDQNDIVY